MSAEDKLKALIQQNYKSIREFSSAVDMPYTTIDSIFKRGLDKASVSNIIKICQHLHISVDGLAGGQIIAVVSNESVPLSPAAQRVGRLYDKASDKDKATVELVLAEYDDDKKGTPDAKVDEHGKKVAAG